MVALLRTGKFQTNQLDKYYRMKTILSLLFIHILFFASAQNDPCLERIFAKSGGWIKGQTINRAGADYSLQKRFTDAAHSMFSSYQPMGLQAKAYSVHESLEKGKPVTRFYYRVPIFSYFCSGDGLQLGHESSYGFRVMVNDNFSRILYDSSTNYDGVGFNVLREGMPQEIKPGVWQFKDVWTPLGFSREGFTKLWFITYPGQLPWVYVSRREFLQKRRSNLLRMMKDEEERLQRNLADLEQQKKNVENVLRSDPAKFAAYLKNDYEPAPKRFKDAHDKSIAALKRAIDRVHEQLEAPAGELNRQAIVIRSEKDYLDYNFTDNWQDRFAEVLIKPNPSYYKKMASPSVPQHIEVGVVYYPLDTVSVVYAKTVEKLVDGEYLQSWIGKTTPPPFAGNRSPQNNASIITNPSVPPISSTSTNKTTTAKSGPKTTSSNTTLEPSAGKGFIITGNLSAPAGVPVAISYNNGNDLTITPPKSTGNLYTKTPIKFTKPINDAEAYAVSIKKIAGNMKGVVYRGSGKAPKGVNDIRIAVDYKYELLTRSTADQAFSNFYETASPAVGGMGGEEGRYVAFVSWTKGFAGNDGKFRQVFWRDRNTGETKLISKSPDGAIADADCNLPTMSGDGQIVVFESKASNLVPGDNNGKKDVFLWRAKTGTIELVSVPSAGGIANGESYDATVSGNGNFVVFTSDAVNMSSIPKGKSLYNIFLRDAVNGKTEMLSVDPTMKAGGNGVKGSISFDGSRITFCSPSNTLAANDNNGMWDIFLWERGKFSLRRISFTHDGKERLQGDESGSRQVASTLSGNGRFVVYSTTAPNMVPGDNLKYQDVFVYDIDNNKLQVASFTNDGQPGNHDSPIDQGDRLAITHDGTWVAFPTKATNLGAQASSNIILYNTQTGKKQAVTDTRGSYVGRPAISYSGSYVVFGKSEPLDQRSGAAFGDNGGGIFAHFTGNGPCRDCKE